MSLILDLRAGERLIINGASLRFRGKTALAIETNARFVFGRQVLEECDANTPLHRLYLLIQRAYAEEPEREADHLAEAREEAVWISDPAAGRAVREAVAGRWYDALLVVREAITRAREA